MDERGYFARPSHTRQIGTRSGRMMVNGTLDFIEQIDAMQTFTNKYCAFIHFTETL
jgi:hypothetical protein